MNRIFFLLIALIIFSVRVSAQDMYRVKADKLNVRETNNPKSKVIGFIRENENVAVLDSTDAKYFKVKVTNGEGWVSKEYLVKIATAPKSVQEKTPGSVEIPKVAKDYSNAIFFSIFALIMGIILFFIFKYSKQSKILIGLSTIVVLIVGYFCFVTFIKEKTVTGSFTNDSDAQYQSFDFKTSDSVIVKDVYADSTFTAKYVIEGDMIKLYDQQNMILLLIRDENTLIGEGFTKGTFKKN